jgi:HEAT repeat protein
MQAVLLLAFPLCLHSQVSPGEQAPGAATAGLPPPSIDRAWSMLTSHAAPDKSQQDRIQALAALSSMGVDPRAEHLIGQAITGHDMDVRTAAILAADKTKNPQLIDELRAALDDKEPQVAYAAATTLWKMHDSSGEDLLLAVVAGDQPVKPGKIKREKHKAAKELHNPRTLATMGIEHGGGFFLGPFGFGLKAIEFIHKNGGDPDRAAAVDFIAEEHTEEVHAALIDALDDKDFAVRAAAARALGNWPGRDTANHLRKLFDDDRTAVRLTAAASFIRVYDPHPSPEADDKSKEPHVHREIPPRAEPGLQPKPTEPPADAAPAPQAQSTQPAAAAPAPASASPQTSAPPQ